jgi:hypothetical protein
VGADSYGLLSQDPFPSARQGSEPTPLSSVPPPAARSSFLPRPGHPPGCGELATPSPSRSRRRTPRLAVPPRPVLSRAVPARRAGERRGPGLHVRAGGRGANKALLTFSRGRGGAGREEGRRRRPPPAAATARRQRPTPLPPPGRLGHRPASASRPGQPGTMTATTCLPPRPTRPHSPPARPPARPLALRAVTRLPRRAPHLAPPAAVAAVPSLAPGCAAVAANKAAPYWPHLPAPPSSSKIGCDWTIAAQVNYASAPRKASNQRPRGVPGRA